MERLNKDEISSIGLSLDVKSLLNFSLTNKHINRIIEKIWICKLNKEFEDFPTLNIDATHKYIYEILYSLTNLKNRLKLHENVYQLYKLEHFNFHDDMVTMSKEICYMKNLTDLDLSSNRFTEISKEICKLINLKVLYLYYNRLEEIPQELFSLINLQELNLNNNNISVIPEEIGNLSKLETLSLSCNYIESIPAELGNLFNLEKLYLSGNNFSSLPEQLSNLTKLKELHTRSNKTIFIPSKLLENKNLHIEFKK